LPTCQRRQRRKALTSTTPAALYCTKVSICSSACVSVRDRYSFSHSCLDDPSLHSTLSAKHQPPHYTQIYENNMQTSPPVSHQVYYKSETQYGWPDYNSVSFKLDTRELVTNSIFSRASEVPQSSSKIPRPQTTSPMATINGPSVRPPSKATIHQ
jgi:hypothetical protein